MAVIERETTARRFLRPFVRWTTLVLFTAAYLLLPARWPAYFLCGLSPYVSLCSAIAARALSIAVLCGIPMLVVVAIFRRWHCRWTCPVGLIIGAAGRLLPGRHRTFKKLPPVGLWLMLMTFGGAFFAWPLFIWLDPLAVFSGTINGLRPPFTLVGFAAAGGLLLIVALGLLLPNVWCARLCPLGGMQDMVWGLRRMAARKSEDESRQHSSETRLARRVFIGTGVGAAYALVASVFRASSSTRLLRPPGGADDDALGALCARCGNCIEACPTNIIKRNTGVNAPGGFLTPAISFDDGYCLEDCHECTTTCPTGAIRRMTLQEKNEWRIGCAEIDKSTCVLAADEECGYCTDRCPFKAIVQEFSRESYTWTVSVKPGACNGCGACVGVCPVDAVVVRPLGPDEARSVV